MNTPDIAAIAARTGTAAGSAVTGLSLLGTKSQEPQAAAQGRAQLESGQM